MKKYVLSMLALFTSISTMLYAGPRGRGYEPDAPDLGMPGGNEVFTGLIIAIIAIPIGYAILNAGKKKTVQTKIYFLDA